MALASDDKAHVVSSVTDRAARTLPEPLANRYEARQALWAHHRHECRQPDEGLSLLCNMAKQKILLAQRADSGWAD